MRYLVPLSAVPSIPSRIAVLSWNNLENYFLDRDPLFGLPLSPPFHAEDQKKRDIQNSTAKKIRRVSCNLEK
ncbi:UNVERIFIED_CONTAM: hypothetical protein Sindi_0387300, partial [Sesamum indicum]